MSRSPEWNRLVTDADLGGPDWIDPAADHHRDLAALTRAIRAELAQAAYTVNGTLDMIERAHPNADWRYLPAFPPAIASQRSVVPDGPLRRAGGPGGPGAPGALWKMMRPPSGNRRVLWLPGGRCFR